MRVMVGCTCIYIYIYIFSQVVEYFMLVWPGYDVNGFRIWLSDIKIGCACIPIFSEIVEYLYACITRFWMSLIFMFGCACIFVLSEIMEYMYACKTRLWGHRFLYLKMPICLCFPKLWSAYIWI
jgi:hypothetical protein